VLTLQVEDTAITNSGRRLDLSAASVATMSRDGFNVSASAKYTYLDLPSNFYLVQYLFDQSLEKSATQSYMSAATVASIEVQLNQTLFINNVRVFPISNGSSTSFKVSSVFYFYKQLNKICAIYIYNCVNCITF